MANEGTRVAEAKWTSLVGIAERDFAMLKEMALHSDKADLRIEGLRLLWSNGGSEKGSPVVYQEIFKESAENDPDVYVRREALELVRDPEFLDRRALLDGHLLARDMARSTLHAVQRTPKGGYIGPDWEY